ncbi:MAG: nucleoside kinase [Bacteroidales bacterium]|nr:nucleoside kinase [Bacteroidales bacterium]MBR5093435.1 nucleoside kinase [Bacteroidales bacterium]
MNDVEIVIANTGERMEITPGTQLAQLAAEYTKQKTEADGKAPWPILGALVNNKVEPLQYRIYNPKVVKFLDIRDRQGFRLYRNALEFMFYTAVHDCYPMATLSIDHSLQNGFYCRIKSAVEGFVLPANDEVCRTVRERMIALQEQDIPFVSKTMLLKDAIELIRPRHMPKTLYVLEHLRQLYIEMNFLGDTVHKINGKLAPSTGCITTWDLRQYGEEGYMLQCADPEHPDKLSLYTETPKLFAIFREHYQWADLLHTATISDYNRIVHNGGGQGLILLAEALHEKKYAEIAEQVRQSGAKMVLLAGPSSSGKTTSCRRLSVQLSVLGYDVNQLSLDDYFMCRERTPKLPNGEYDFESIDALDIPLLNDNLNALFRGEEVKIPTFDFIKGEPYFSGKTLKLGPRSILVVEGIHALNPKLTADIAEELKFKVYVSALTQLSIDDQNIIHGTDNRLVRRLVRDNNFRGWNALETLRRWPEVVRGERKHIFPYQENANVMFNSALLYELGVLKRYAEPLLKQVPEDCEEYSIAQQLLGFSELILPIDDKFIPHNSIMREFLGGSAFEY